MITFLHLSRHFVFSDSQIFISVKMAAVCCSGQCARSCNYYPVRNYRSSNKYKNTASVCVYACMRAWVGAVNSWLLIECRSFFTVTSDWIFTSCVCRGNEKFISMCVRVSAGVWTPFTFLEEIFFWSVIMVHYISYCSLEIYC